MATVSPPDRSYVQEIANALEGEPLGTGSHMDNEDTLGSDGLAGPATPISRPATGSRASGTGSETSYELALAAASEGEWCMGTTVYEMEPSRGSPPRQAADYSDILSSITPNPTQLASSNCSSCGITLVKGNTFWGGKT